MFSLMCRNCNRTSSEYLYTKYFENLKPIKIDCKKFCQSTKHDLAVAPGVQSNGLHYQTGTCKNKSFLADVENSPCYPKHETKLLYCAWQSDGNSHNPFFDRTFV